MTKSSAEYLLEDIAQERMFLERLGNNIPEKLVSESECLTEIYHEMIDQICRHRVDIELFKTLETVDPTGFIVDAGTGERIPWHEKRKSITRLLEQRRITVKIIRDQLVELVHAEHQN